MRTIAKCLLVALLPAVVSATASAAIPQSLKADTVFACVNPDFIRKARRAFRVRRVPREQRGRVLRGLRDQRGHP